MNNETTKNFIQKVIETYESGHAREHSYRPALKDFFEKVTELKVINEPKRSEYGAPDFVFLKGKIVIAYAEAKDVDVSLAEIEKSEQMERYYGYSNIILTNGLEFRFYRNATPYADPIVIAELKNGSIFQQEHNFGLLEDTIRDFIKESKEPIKSGKILAKVMAGKARRIRDNIKKFLADENSTKNADLLSVYEVIKRLLLADLDKNKFADMYAQTLVYGLFVARYYDEKSDEDFTRQKARDLVPASNPFLRHFFDHIAGSSFDSRIEMIVNELCEEFTHADVEAIVHNYYKVDKDDSRDPIIHFYEDFLQEYDPSERKKMGVFYTPLPVVRFIVRAIDDILKKDFGLSGGLADSSKTKIERDVQGKKRKESVHKVQILDPATGTGTFLNETILQIKKSFVGQEGRWNQYVNNDLLPRLHGFELMMASYTIAHLKLSSTIAETGAKIENTRLGVYLTNSLEKSEAEEQTLFSFGLGKAITEESNQANKVKNELPIMVVMGNPPYNVSSQNKSEWIHDLTQTYKNNLEERNIQPLSDDYIKFVRLAENLIEKNGEGIIGMITNNSFLDGVIHRQMRKHLIETFDNIYILDLHGNSKKKEKDLNGGKDENVFAIQQGVSISIFVKTKSKNKKIADVYHADFFGRQKVKFETLDNSTIQNTKWKKLDYKEPYYFFVPKDFSNESEYGNFFSVENLFNVNNAGVATGKDEIYVNFDKENLIKNLNKSDIDFDEDLICQYNYRLFDIKYFVYDTKLIQRLRTRVMDHIYKKDNQVLVTTKILSSDNFSHVFISEIVGDRCLLSNRGKEANYYFPLYLYTEDGTKISNLKKEIVDKIEKVVGKVSPEDILDYIYAVLYSPNYREKYKEFLKIDFPRVPYPKDAESFKKLVELGRELRGLHLLESPKVNNFITTFSESGSDTVEKTYPKYKNGNVYINEKQYFGGVPEVAWNFYIGGYQPAQKWLKDRRERILSNTDIEHYQKMIVALAETDRIMKEIDKV